MRRRVSILWRRTQWTRRARTMRIHDNDGRATSPFGRRLARRATTLHSYPFSATTGRELTTDAAAVYAAAAAAVADDHDDEDEARPTSVAPAGRPASSSFLPPVTH